jgi:hypothetical protein
MLYVVHLILMVKVGEFTPTGWNVSYDILDDSKDSMRVLDDLEWYLMSAYVL